MKPTRLNMLMIRWDMALELKKFSERVKVESKME